MSASLAEGRAASQLGLTAVMDRLVRPPVLLLLLVPRVQSTHRCIVGLMWQVAVCCFYEALLWRRHSRRKVPQQRAMHTVASAATA
jgi:hypothetical protein